MSYTTAYVQTVLERLQKLHPEIIDLGLDRTFKLLKKLGNPQNNLPPVLHIAGTNGKGSTLSFIQAILESSGLKVHRYTSPELIKFNERYIVAGKEISDDDLVSALEEIEIVNDGTAITFFEITTALAFKLFAENDADVVLLETGLGGRLDSTNVVSNTAVNVITSISLDHEAFLGNSEIKIAMEKAGILRPYAQAVFAPQKNIDVAFTLLSRANDAGAFAHAHKTNWDYNIGSDTFTVSSEKGSIELPHPVLFGQHQFENAATAVVACQRLSRVGIKLKDEDYKQGILNAVHRGRFEKINLPEIENKTVYIDGGHNPSASEAIAKSLQKLNAKNITLICGMLEDKDSAGFIEPIKPFIKLVYTVPVKHNIFSTALGQKYEMLAEIFRQNGLTAIPTNSINDALKQANNDDSNIILCTGSLHLIGDILNIAD